MRKYETEPNARTMTIKATVDAATPLGAEIKTFRLSAPGAFKNAAPGAHVDLFLPNGLNRQYSLCEYDPAGDWGTIGVKHETQGRGGSAWLHTHLKAGDGIEIGEVRNNFVLDEGAPGYLLIAGGIGVTPMVPMAAHLKELGKPFRFLYLARDEAAAGFQPVLQALDLGSALHTHRDDKDGMFDLQAELTALPADHQVYFCGPESLIAAILDFTKDWPRERVHFERFSGGDAAAILAAAPKDGFEVVLAQSGQTFHIPEDQSILDVLLDNGITPSFGCMDGVCGSCTTPVLEGEVDHRDLSAPAEQHDADHTMCICVSRAKGDKLVLDL